MITPEFITYILMYVRLISYTVVILCSMFFLFNLRQYKWIIVGNLFAATFFIISAFFSGIIGIDGSTAKNILITPGAIIWALVHLFVFIKK